MKRDELLADIFAGEARAAALAARCEVWLAASPRFAVFMEANRTKIRKKVRTAEGAEGLGDLLRELEAAYLLLEQRQVELAYEAYAAERARGPDFSVTLKGHLRCTVEVKRLRVGPRALDARLSDAICQKLRQMPPSLPNLLWVAVEGPEPDAASAIGVAGVMKRLLQRAERKDEALFARHGYADARAFFAQYLRLSGVLAYRADGVRRELWFNSQARHPLQAPLTNWLSRFAASADLAG